MEKRYFFQIAYNGEKHSGWQRQKKQSSIQEVIETKLQLIFGKFISIIGCGRTDAGVHASNYFFHCDLPPVTDTDHLIFKLNRMLPPEISIHQILEVSIESHARFHAIERTYRYQIHSKKNPFKERLSYYVPQTLSFLKMNEAAGLLIGKHDFTSFAKLHTDVATNVCVVMQSEWIQEDDNNWCFEITANRFLRNMVRAVVGTLLEVGLGKIEPNEIKKILAEKDRNSAGKSVPAHGLYLHNVKYPDTIF